MVTEGRAPPWDPETQRPDVAVLVGLPRELRELCAVAGQGYPWPNATYGGDDYLLLAPNDRGRAYRVVVFFMGDESGNAAVQAGNRLLALQPALVVSLGVACSLDAKALRIGDVIVAEQVDGFEEHGRAQDDAAGGWTMARGGEVYRATHVVARMTDQLEFSEPEAWRAWKGACARDLVELVGEGEADRRAFEVLVGDGTLRERPSLVKAHLASGVTVAAAKAFRAWVLGRDRNIKALEMEAVGVLRAAQERREVVPTLVLRGVSAVGGVDEVALEAIGDGALRKTAMRNATRLLWALMRTGRLPQAEDRASEPAVPRRALPRPVALPRLGHALIGRTKEIERLSDALLAQPPVPAVVLGPGGFGKSTIAMQALHHERVAAMFGARRFFVRLDAATTTIAAVELIAKQIGVTVSKDPLAEVAGALGRERAVLVLDNYESVWGSPGAAELPTQLASVDGLALVVTVRGLAIPPGVPSRCRIEAKRFSIDESAELFTSISGYDDGPELRALLAKMDGVPLAIQLLAHAAPPDGLSLLAEDWERRKTAVLARDGGGDDREWSWRASLEVSWGSVLMTEMARRAASVLAVLPDGLAERDRGAVLAVDGPAAASLLTRLGLAYVEDDRLRMLAPVREYIEVHHRPGAEDLQRTAEHYRELAETLGPKPGWEGGREAIARLSPEIANLDAMLRHGLDTQPSEPWIRAAAALGKFARVSGRSSPNPLHHAATRANENGDLQGQADCIHGLGEIALRRSENEQARALYEQAKPLYEHVGDVLGQANCIRGLGEIALRRSEYDQARALYEQAEPLYAQTGALLGQANCIKSLGNIAFEHSEHEQARELYEQAKRFYELLSDPLGQANCIRSLGDIAFRRSEHEQARALYEEAKPLYERVGALLGQANCIKSLGNIAFHRAEHEQARALYEEAKPLYEHVGDVLGGANCIKSLGDIASRCSEHERARALYEQAKRLYERLGAVLGQANCIRSLGDIALADLKHEHARALYDQALTISTSVREPYSMGRAHVGLAHVAMSEVHRATHVAEARRLWALLGMPHLLQYLDATFGPAR